MKITAIDFETANASSASVCAVGIASYEDGKISTYYSLIKPAAGYDYFHPGNIRIHHIYPKDVCDAPSFKRVYEEMGPFLKDSVLCAHNASFDMNCLKESAKVSGITLPDYSYFDTVLLSKHLYPQLSHHRLNDMCSFLNIALHHHHAGSDAYGCLMIVLKSMERFQSYTLHEFLRNSKIRVKKLETEKRGKTMELKCRECRECNGLVCRGEIPGVGGKDSGTSFINNFEALKRVRINMNVCADPGEISTSCNILGIEMSMPVFVAPIAGIKMNYGADIDDMDYNRMVLEGCEELGIRGFTGDGVNMVPMFGKPAEAIDANNGHGIVTMKPWVKEGIDARAELISGLSYDMAAMDVDAAGLPLLRAGKTPVETKNAEALKYVKDKLGKKFIVKGVMTVEAAETAVEAGADAIVVSNHGGRVMDCTPGTAEVLPEIVKAVGGKITVLVDGGIRSGNDVFKCLALGADGVLIGRPAALSVVKNGKEGLVEFGKRIKDQLAQAMLMTGCHTIEDITSDKIRI